MLNTEKNSINYNMEDTKTHKIVLHNDNQHDFLYVIACLIRFCKHDAHQAEQCALIADGKGSVVQRTEGKCLLTQGTEGNGLVTQGT